MTAMVTLLAHPSRTRCLPQESLGPGDSAGRVLYHQRPCYNSAPTQPLHQVAIMINQATPYNYPVPLRDEGNMSDVLSHPQNHQGPSLEWLKKP
ncbi:hypothetical protein HPG69_003035 [Diceros bicornis minor]|uniref:NADH dehydrogenase [ubiquinone] 1 alpha subcomplex subunit 3 n=1 Tax=Diceros bicornis minor TaxID=77932 RepID=A0A7J7EJH3_DICBM|nr:hypothetical protein HPG69_003035 [Diceros bicornis minor]